MKKTTYYLWRHEFKTEEEYEKKRQKRKQMGYRVVTFVDGPKDKDIHEGLKAIIRNHMYQIFIKESFCPLAENLDERYNTNNLDR